MIRGKMAKCLKPCGKEICNNKRLSFNKTGLDANQKKSILINDKKNIDLMTEITSCR
jgi:hypothetical protein